MDADGPHEVSVIPADPAPVQSVLPAERSAVTRRSQRHVVLLHGPGFGHHAAPIADRTPPGVARRERPEQHRSLISNKGRLLSVDVVRRTVRACARIAGIGHVHPHQLRHTLATQSINNGMRLDAVSAMLGHRTMRMTLVDARIADRTVANEYFAAANKVDQLYMMHSTTSPASGPQCNADLTAGSVILRTVCEFSRQVLGEGAVSRVSQAVMRSVSS